MILNVKQIKNFFPHLNIKVQKAASFVCFSHYLTQISMHDQKGN
jgi:hypothetical protein